MQFRLLIDFDVIDHLQKMEVDRRRRILLHFRKMQSHPGHYSDFIHQDSQGRRLDVSLFDGLAIYYWIDAADRQIKILEIVAAD